MTGVIDRADASTDLTRTVAIIGAGAAGTYTAIHLLRSTGVTIDVVLFDGTGTFGPGIAYSTRDDAHVLNVPAGKLSAFSDDPDHFVNWARGHHAEVKRGSYLPRSRYGQYLVEELAAAEAVAHDTGSTLRRVTGRAIAIERGEVQDAVVLEDGERISADAIVLALGMQDATLPDVLDVDVPGVYASPWAPGALDNIAEGEHVLLVGSSLTAVDAALSCVNDAEDVQVTMLSRTGKMSLVHLRGTDADDLRPPAPAPVWPEGVLTAATVVNVFCQSVADAARDGFEWQDVLDAARPRTQQVWQAMPPEERRRFLAMYEREWAIRRHRMAPEVGERLRSALDDGSITRIAGTLVSIDASGAPALEATLQLTEGGDPIALTCDRIITCAGFAEAIDATTDPLLIDLLASGRICADALGISMRGDEFGRVIDASGDAETSLYALGAARRGELWETTALAEIREQAEAIAGVIVRGAVSADIG